MKISATIPDDLGEWMKNKIKDGTFYNTSHALKRALIVLKEDLDAKKEKE